MQKNKSDFSYPLSVCFTISGTRVTSHVKVTKDSRVRPTLTTMVRFEKMCVVSKIENIVKKKTVICAFKTVCYIKCMLHQMYAKLRFNLHRYQICL